MIGIDQQTSSKAMGQAKEDSLIHFLIDDKYNLSSTVRLESL